MDRTAGVGLAAYAALVVSLATPLYDPLFSGDDEWWVLPALLVFAHLGLGAAVGRWWALLLPLATSVGFLALGGRLSLGNLCPEAGTEPRVERRLRRQTEVLIRELGRRPNELVTYTLYFSPGDDERRDITIRELAEEQLADLETGGPNCAPELQRRIRAAL